MSVLPECIDIARELQPAYPDSLENDVRRLQLQTAELVRQAPLFPPEEHATYAFISNSAMGAQVILGKSLIDKGYDIMFLPGENNLRLSVHQDDRAAVSHILQSAYRLPDPGIEVLVGAEVGPTDVASFEPESIANFETMNDLECTFEDTSRTMLQRLVMSRILVAASWNVSQEATISEAYDSRRAQGMMPLQVEELQEIGSAIVARVIDSLPDLPLPYRIQQEAMLPAE